MSDTMKGLSVLIILGILWIPVVWQIWAEATAPSQTEPAKPMPRLYRTPQDAERAARRAEAWTEFTTNIFCGLMIIVFSVISFALFIAMLKLIIWLVIWPRRYRILVSQCQITHQA